MLDKLISRPRGQFSGYFDVAQELIKALTCWIFHELMISYQFVRRDLTTTVIPNLIWILAAFKVRPEWDFRDVAVALACTVLYFWLYVYTFCLANQIVGVEEDRINKPDRPLISGLVSYRGAQRRFVLAMIAFALIGWWFGVLAWALLWQACVVLHNFGGWSRHWFTKNLVIMPVGAIALLAPAWELVTPLDPAVWRWIIIVAVAIGLPTNLQDLRDICGDRVMRRTTLPLSWGEKRTRIALSISFILLSFEIHFGLMMPAGHTWKVFLCDAWLAAMNLLVAARIVLLRTPSADHKSYMLYTYWYCCVMASAIILL